MLDPIRSHSAAPHGAAPHSAEPRRRRPLCLLIALATASFLLRMAPLPCQVQPPGRGRQASWQPQIAAGMAARHTRTVLNTQHRVQVK